ncbi:MAG TPA: hypothetical protein VM598_01255 [Bdellovibrionota bacterium]|nr:hypothetical protein [Bdellovibrionota bacterium]
MAEVPLHEEEFLSSLFARPLIAGASVSADYFTLSPGKRLALIYARTQGDVLTIARGSVPGRETLARISDRLLATRTIVIAIDAFFWDSTGTDCLSSVEAARAFVEKCQRHRVPVVLGDIPGLLHGRQPCRYFLNRAIRDLPRQFPLCRVLHLDHLYQRELKGELKIRGSHHALGELLPDGLHVSRLASEHLTERLRRLCIEFRGAPEIAPETPQPAAG